MAKTKTKLRQNIMAAENPDLPAGEMPNKEKEHLFSIGGELVVDVFETPSHFMVLSAIAGVQIKDLDISIEKEMMVIRGHRVAPDHENERKYFYQECYWGPFSRKIVLPQDLDIASADAQMDKGLLTIAIPRLDRKGQEQAFTKETPTEEV